MDEQIEAVEQAIETAFRTSPRVLASASLISLAVGVTVGVAWANRRLQRKYEDLSNKEIELAQDHYEELYQERVQQLEEKLEKASASKNPRVITDAKVVSVRVGGTGTTIVEVPEDVRQTFVDYGNRGKVRGTPMANDPELAETDIRDLANRDTSVAHYITEDEFNENLEDFEQFSLTYYCGDGVLTDDHDQPVEDIALLIDPGIINLFLADENLSTVHCRNPKLSALYEIERSDGEYSKEVAGFTDS
jgi:hypothetical protein